MQIFWVFEITIQEVLARQIRLDDRFDSNSLA